MDATFLLTILVSVPLFILIAWTIVDVVRRSDLSGVRKTVWVVVVVVLPAIGTLIYMLARPFRDPAEVRVGEVNDVSRELLELLAANERGEIEAAEFVDRKTSIFEFRGDGGQAST